MAETFVHLRVHSEYSMVDGLVRVKPLVSRVAELGMPAVGLTEQSNMCSLVRFYKAALGAGVKPIIGADLWLVGRDFRHQAAQGQERQQWDWSGRGRAMRLLLSNCPRKTQRQLCWMP